MIAYIPTPITSVEQAEALPEGTIIRYLLAPTVLISDEERVWVDGEDTVMTGADVYAARDVWEVLVPVRAEEETRTVLGWAGTQIPEDQNQARLVTPWEPVSGPDRRGDCE